MITPSEDSGLRCPQCEYNLTGTTEGKCPDCGAPFTLEGIEAHTKRCEKLNSRIMVLAVISIMVAIWGRIQPYPRGGMFFFGAGPDVARICCIVPLQVGIALFAIRTYSSLPSVERWRWWPLIGVVLTVLLSIPTMMSFKGQ